MKKLLSLLLLLLMLTIVSPVANANNGTIVMSYEEYEQYITELYGEPLGYPLPAEVAKISTEFEWMILRDTNRERMKAGSSPLSTNATMQKAAKIRVDELLISYSHIRPNGTIPTTAFKDVGLSAVEVMNGAELCAASFPTAAVSAWLKSNKHRYAMLSNAYVHSGVGVLKSPTKLKYFEVQLLLPERSPQRNMSFLLPPSMEFPAGTSIDSMGIAVKVNCPDHGNCYLPLLDEMCTGYDSAKTGIQAVTVKYDYIYQKNKKGSLLGAFLVSITDPPEEQYSDEGIEKLTKADFLHKIGDNR